MRGGVEPTRLDPTRLDLGPEPVPARRGGLRGPLGSLLLHLLPLLVLMTWLRPPLEIPAPIPVQLVIEQPPPPPAPVPAEPKPRATPPPGRLASDDFGKVGQAKGPKSPETEHPEQSKPPSSGTEKPAAPASGERGTAEQQEQTAEPTKTAALVAPPVIDPPPPLALSVERIAPPPPTPAAPKPPAPKPTAAERPRTLTGLVLPLPLRADSANAGAASSRYPGPDATRDEYCAYALYLVLKHLDLLPDSLVGARRGETVLTIRLRDDGAILGTAVAESSGYLDIDDQAVRMVNAVGKFPPLPAWVPGRTADFRFRLHFPHAAAR